MALLLELIGAKIHPPKDTKPSFAGCNVIVTGANSGVGFEAALKFVQLGADRVILGVRTLSKGDVAKAAIEHKTGRKNVVDVWHVDMLDYESLKSFADRASKELEHLDIVVLNAGVLMASYQQSSYGWEKTLQVNSLSTTLLGLLLMPKLKASKTPDFTPKLELVSSTIFLSATKLKSDGGKDPHAGPLAVYNRHDEKQSSVEFSMSQYQASKLFLEYAHKGLADLAMSNKAGEPNVIVVSVCPGATKSDIARDHTSMFMRSALWLMSLMQRSSEQGSRTYISGVAFGKEAHGRFWVSDTFRETEAPLNTGEKGKQLQAQVWQEIIDALKKDFPEVAALTSR